MSSSNELGSRAWQALRTFVLERDGNVCQLRLPGCTRDADCVDHVIARSEGGDTMDPANCRASCTSCNTSRGAARRAALAKHAIDSATGSGHLGDYQPSRVW